MVSIKQDFKQEEFVPVTTPKKSEIHLKLFDDHIKI